MYILGLFILLASFRGGLAETTQPDYKHLNLDLEEKIILITGNGSAGACTGNLGPIPRMNFTGMCLADGTSTVTQTDLVSIFPAGLTTGATWDKDLMYRRAVAMGEEFRGKGVNVALAPVCGPLGQNALGGRNWEGFSSDPYLAGIATGLTVSGIQSMGVQTSVKHYIANEQETQRSNSTSAKGQSVDAISSNLDNRTLHELYLWPFADSVKAGASSIMCSYNRINQVYGCENSALLNDVLKKELGFLGFVVADWFATHSTAESINAGLDMEMPGWIDSSFRRPDISVFFGEKIIAAVRNGSVTEGRVDEMVRRVMTPYFYMGQDAPDYPSPDPVGLPILLSQNFGIAEGLRLGLLPAGDLPTGRDVRGDHASLIREVGAAGTVLLKNVNSTLPLSSPRWIGVFGNDATDFSDGLTGRAIGALSSGQGTLSIGGGGGAGRHTYIVPPLEAIKAKARSTGAIVQYITNNTLLEAANEINSIYPIPEVCIVFLKSFASEGSDRTSLEADGNSTAIVENVAALCPNTVVVTHSVGTLVTPWAKDPNVKAILAANLPGQESGNSIVDILWGDVNPSGKLPYTIPVNETDYPPPITNITRPVSNSSAWQADFTEGQLIDYRHFDAKNITPLYEFGFGLSYTTFDIPSPSPLVITRLAPNISVRPDAARPTEPRGNPDLWLDLVSIETKVSNTGSVAGHSVPQLYLSLPSTTPGGTPVRILRGFERIYLQPGEAKSVKFMLQRRDLSFWDTEVNIWVIPSGLFSFQVGFSSRDLRSKGSLAVLS